MTAGGPYSLNGTCPTSDETIIEPNAWLHKAIVESRTISFYIGPTEYEDRLAGTHILKECISGLPFLQNPNAL